MNECLFFTQIFLIIGFVWGILKLGKEALIAWVVIQALMANLFVLKQVTLFGCDVTASDAFAVGSLLGLSFLQEYFSREDANKATWICFLVMIFFTLASQCHLLYQPSSYDTTQSAFLTILSPIPRLLIASLSVFFIVQRIDIRCFGYLKRFYPKSSFALRTMLSLLISQTLDTVLFSFLGLYGLVVSITNIILISLTVKYLVIFCLTFFIQWAKHGTISIRADSSL